MNRLLQRVFWAAVLLVGLCVAADAEDGGWPRTVSVENGLVTIYPLQVDGVSGDVVHYRAALAWRPTPDAEPIFGAGWFDSEVAIDRDNRIVRPLNLTVTNTRFPSGTDAVQAGLAAALAEQAPAWNLDYSLDELNTALKVAEAEAKSALELNTAPPRIIYRDHPALLVTLDGEPVLREIENSPYKAVINTPYPLISDGRHFYLNPASGAWYRADAATGPYRFEPDPPAAIAAMVKPEAASEPEGQPAAEVTAADAPEIVVSTQPAELIVTDGPAVFVPLVEDLLVLQNSDDDVFMHVGSQQFYIVLSGRWYRASSLDGPWSHQPVQELPAAFADIPPDSAQADARVHVAGTPEAEEAVLDAQVPQTAAVARGEVDLDVAYDGDPDFRPVDGTDLRYAANTGSTVLRSDRRYYLVEDGVWYVSASPNGPWVVSDYRPATVTAIAPTSPVYHVKYVYIYDSTPDVVYVGYTPGYFGSYVYYGTVVYGTGWYYRPWVSPYYYYPRPHTWGFHPAYSPWSGWGFGLSWGWGPFYANYYSGGYWHHNHWWHHPHYSYWGPRGYRPRHPHHGHGGHGYDRYARDFGGRHDYGGDVPDYRPGGRYGGRHDNLYRDRAQRATVRATHDNLPRLRQPGAGVPWQARNDPDRRAGASRDYGAAGKGGGNRTHPVTAADMRRKAQVRDADSAARRSTLIADSDGNIVRPRTYRGATPAGGDALRTKPVAGARNRTLPVTDSVPRNEPARDHPGVAGQTVERPTRAPARRAQAQDRTRVQPQAPARRAQAQDRTRAQPEAPARQAQVPPRERAAQRRLPAGSAAATRPEPMTASRGASQRQRDAASRTAPPASQAPRPVAQAPRQRQGDAAPVQRQFAPPARAPQARQSAPQQPRQSAAPARAPQPRQSAPQQPRQSAAPARAPQARQSAPQQPRQSAAPARAPQPRQSAPQQPRPPVANQGPPAHASAPVAQQAPQRASRDAGGPRDGADRGDRQQREKRH